MLEGGQGHLFVAGDANGVLDQHTSGRGAGRLTTERWRRLHRRRVKALKERSIPWVWSIAPDKESVFADCLPDGMRAALRRPVHDILGAALAEGVPARYPVEELRDLRSDTHPYYETDTHWNRRGAHTAYSDIIGALQGSGIGVEPVAQARIEWIETEEFGDLGGRVVPPRAGRTVDARLSGPQARIVADNRVPNHGRLIRFESQREQPRAVVFGESFANHMLLFLKESFSRLVFAHTSGFDFDLIDREKPDVVIAIPTERFLVRCPRDRGTARRLARIRRRKQQAGYLRDGRERFLEGIPGAGESPAYEGPAPD